MSVVGLTPLSPGVNYQAWVVGVNSRGEGAGTALELYDLVGQTGPIYADIHNELREIHDYLNALLDNYAEQCRQLEQVNALVQAGNIVSAKRLMDGMKRIFAVVPYSDFDQTVEQRAQLVRQAEDMERRVKRSRSFIIGALTTQSTKDKLWQEYDELSRSAATLSDCELKEELLRRLASVEVLGGYSSLSGSVKQTPNVGDRPAPPPAVAVTATGRACPHCGARGTLRPSALDRRSMTVLGFLLGGFIYMLFKNSGKREFVCDACKQACKIRTAGGWIALVVIIVLALLIALVNATLFIK